jgi:hypothetical protein
MPGASPVARVRSRTAAVPPARSLTCLTAEAGACCACGQVTLTRTFSPTFPVLRRITVADSTVP